MSQGGARNSAAGAASGLAGLQAWQGDRHRLQQWELSRQLLWERPVPKWSRVQADPAPGLRISPFSAVRLELTQGTSTEQEGTELTEVSPGGE